MVKAPCQDISNKSDEGCLLQPAPGLYRLRCYDLMVVYAKQTVQNDC